MDKVEKRRTRRNKGTERSKAREATGLEGPKSRSSRIKYFVGRIPIEARNRADRTDRDPGNRRHTAVTIAELGTWEHELLGRSTCKSRPLRQRGNYGRASRSGSQPPQGYPGGGKPLSTTSSLKEATCDAKDRSYRGIRQRSARGPGPGRSPRQTGSPSA